MSFSAHRPGRFGSDGRIEFTTDEEREQYLDDILAAQNAANPDADARDHTSEPWGAPPADDEPRDPSSTTRTAIPAMTTRPATRETTTPPTTATPS